MSSPSWGRWSPKKSIAATSAFASSGSSRAGLGEAVAVGLGVDLDHVAVQLRVEHVGAAAEVDDVEHVDVAGQLLDRDPELLADLGGQQRAVVAGGVDHHPGERDQAGEALRPDHGLGLAVGAAAALGLGDRRAGDRLGGLEVLGVALAQQVAALLGLGGELGRVEHLRVLAPAEQPGDELARGGELGLEDRALARALESPLRAGSISPKSP